MAKDKTETPAERAARKAAQKSHSTTDDVLHTKVDADAIEKHRKHKKDKHREKKKSKEEALLKEAATEAGATENGVVTEGKADEVMADGGADAQVEDVGVVDTRPAKQRPVGPLIAFADPLADEKSVRKLLKGVEKSAKAKTLKRGVKEVNKAIRYTPTKFSSPPEALCIIAGDISPMDVVSHLPVFCEKHFIPYVFVPSRDKLGQAGLTTRPTSVVLVCREHKNMSKEEKSAWHEEYKSLCKLVEKNPRRMPIV